MRNQRQARWSLACHYQNMNEHLCRLSILLGERQREIIDKWKLKVRKLPRAQNLDEPLLLDHVPQMLRELSSILTQAQTLSILEMTAHESAREHGAIRFQLGFDVEQVVAEFGLLRDIVQDFAEANLVNITGEVNRTVNRVIDKAIAASLETYVLQQAEELQRKRREYLSFIVHDLKTPISAMAMAANVIDQKLAAERSAFPVVFKMLELVRRNAARLNDRVMEIINEESRLQVLTNDATGLPLQRRDVDLWPVIERLKQDYQTIADSHGNTIRNEVPPELRVYADPELLLEVLRNLLSNALKYTTNGEIVVGAREDSDSVVCWVSDTGIGIPPEHLDRIFQKGAADPNIPGSTGLGLSVVEKVMRLHGGKVSFESTPGIGSSFQVEFPRRNNKAA
jgi:two-component system, OmpR family, phosphate regulon sensor histidine kinase PhoR